MKTQRYNKDYAFLDVLQNRINPPWYIKIILLFIPQRKCIADDAILYYKIFRGVVYITNCASCSGGSVDLRKAQPSSTMWLYTTHQKEDGMPTDEIIIRLFCMVDNQIADVNKRSDAKLYPSEIVTIGLLFALKGGRF